MPIDDVRKDAALSRLPQKPRASFNDMALPALAIGSGGLLLTAMPHLINAQDVMDYAKSGLLAGAATLVSYGVNKLAIERGALQAAIGTRGALLVSTASIAFVGAGLFISTLAGLTLQRSDELRLAEYAQSQSAYIAAQNQAAQQSARIGPAMQVVFDDFREKENCERRSSCISGVGSGGEGAVFRATSSQRQKAEAVLAQITAGRQVRDSAQTQLAVLQAEAQQLLVDDTLKPGARRIELQRVSTQIHQSIAALEEAAPASLVAAYAEDLQRGVIIPDRPAASGTLSAIMRGHGNGLARVVNAATPERALPPTFPAKTGVSDSLSYLGHFLPIAMIVAVVELVFPITLWLYTYFGLCERIERNTARTNSPNTRSSRRGPKKGDFS